MSPAELRDHTREEIDELGPEPPGTELELWREERWGAVVPLAGLADDNPELLRQAGNETAAECSRGAASPRQRSLACGCCRVQRI